MTTTLSAKTSVLNRADGSAEWRQGSCHTICSVNGPMEVRSRDEIPDRATIELVVRPAIGLSTTRETLLENRIYSVISACLLRGLNPRTLFQIVIQIIESGEPREYTALELASSINACSVALLDAGAPLRGVFVAAAAVILESNEIVWNPDLDFFTKNDKSITSQHAISFSIVASCEPKLLLCESTGDFTEKDVFILLDQALEHCQAAYNNIRTLMEDKMTKEFVWNES